MVIIALDQHFICKKLFFLHVNHIKKIIFYRNLYVFVLSTKRWVQRYF
jgi:hypothetical protein